MRLPTFYIPHGGGPCFFMEWTYGPKDTWDRMAGMLRALPGLVPERPRALLVISAHWECDVPSVLCAQRPPMLYDYRGFPPHTYQLSWPAKGSPTLATRVQSLLTDASIASRAEDARGFDHGVFVPMLLAYPDADVPTVQLSLKHDLDANEHLAIGHALAPLRDEGVLIIGSGMSYHNMQRHPDAASASARFDRWLTEAVESDPSDRDRALSSWMDAPAARICHPRSEHLMPLFVAAGAGDHDRGRRTYTDNILGAAISAYAFG